MKLMTGAMQGLWSTTISHITSEQFDVDITSIIEIYIWCWYYKRYKRFVSDYNTMFPWIWVMSSKLFPLVTYITERDARKIGISPNNGESFEELI